jgi:serine/threonine protein kinase
MTTSGKTVGEYVLTEKIGKGSYADVYKGVHKVTMVRYAIKTINKDSLSLEPRLVAGLESEIKIMKEFVHEHIVCLHEFFSSEKNFYLVLELCSGDLHKYIRKQKFLEERVAVGFLLHLVKP